MNVFELAAKLTLDTTEYEQGLRGAESGAHKFGKQLNTGINKLLKIGAVAAGAAAAGVVAFSKAAVNTGMQFDTAMSQVAATMGVTTDEIQELRDYAQQMGASSAFSATQAAQALNLMALAGYDAQQSMEMLPNVLNLAAAGSMDLARASDMLTDSQSALGLTMDETNDLVDKMAQTASKSNTSVEQLGDAILTVGGTAKILSGGTTELSTALGILADNGIKGAEGGTALRNIILALSAPTETAKKKLDELGVSVFDAEGKMRGLNEIFGDLDESMSDLTQEQRMEALATIFNNRDLKSAEGLLANYGLRWDELSGYIDNAAGAAEKMAETQLDNLSGDITLMNSALEGAKIAFSDGIAPALRNIVQMVTKALSNPKTTKFLKEAGAKIGEVAVRLTELAGGLLTRVINLFKNGGTELKAFAISFGALVVAVKGFNVAMTVAAKGPELLANALKFVKSPMGAAITALGVLTVALGALAIAVGGAVKSYSTLSEAQRDNIDAAMEQVDAYTEARDERIRGIASIEDETKKTQDLWAELQTLVDENGKVIGSKERARDVVDELNARLGTEFELEDDLLTNYQEQAAAIDDLIQKKHALRLLEIGEENAEAARQRYRENQDEIFDLEADIAELQQKRQDALAELAEINSRFASGDWTDYSYEVDQLQQQADDIQRLIDERQNQLDTLREAERQDLLDIEAYEAAYRAAAEGNYNEVAEILEADTYKRLAHKAEVQQLTQDELDELKRGRDIAQATLERYQADIDAGLIEGNQKILDELNNTIAEYNAAIDAQEAAAKAAGQNQALAFVQGILDKFGFAIDVAGQLGREAAAAMNGGAGGGGGGSGHAGGLDYVPYDNYAANLHRGEAVLTAREAEEWRRGEGSRQVVNNFTFNGVSQSDLDMIVAYVNRGVVMG